MLNEKRVKQMARMAIFEKNESARYSRMLNISRKDYVSYHTVFGFIIGTILYTALYGGVVIALFCTVLENITMFLLALFIVLFFLGYIIFLYVFLNGIRHRAWKRFNAAKSKVKRVLEDYDTLEQIYEEEDRAKKPSQDTMIMDPSRLMNEL